LSTEISKASLATMDRAVINDAVAFMQNAGKKWR
jgi:hypothetical protein